MSQTTDKSTRTMPSATPSEAEIAEWAALPRDEQERRYQEMFRHPDCNTFTTDTPDDILAAARHQVAARVMPQLAGIDHPPIQLMEAEEADLAAAEAEIERGELASDEEVPAMWAKHGL
jgi:predicted transcriptional regulator